MESQRSFFVAQLTAAFFCWENTCLKKVGNIYGTKNRGLLKSWPCLVAFTNHKIYHIYTCRNNNIFEKKIDIYIHTHNIIMLLPLKNKNKEAAPFFFGITHGLSQNSPNFASPMRLTPSHHCCTSWLEYQVSTNGPKKTQLVFVACEKIWSNKIYYPNYFVDCWLNGFGILLV